MLTGVLGVEWDLNDVVLCTPVVWYWALGREFVIREVVNKDQVRLDTAGHTHDLLALSKELTNYSFSNMINLTDQSSIDISKGRERVSILRVNDSKTGWQTRSIKDLVLIKGVRGYSWLHWSDGSRQMMAYTIKYYGNKLPESDFIRVHQNCIVNRNLIQKILITHRGPFLRLLNGEEIIISRRRWTVLKRDLLKQS